MRQFYQRVLMQVFLDGGEDAGKALRMIMKWELEAMEEEEEFGRLSSKEVH